MKKKLLSLAFLSAAGVAMAIGLAAKPIANPLKVEAAHAESVDVFGTHNYFTGTGGALGNNSVTEQGETGSRHFKMTSLASGGDSAWFGMDGAQTMHGGKYIFRAKVKLDADYKGDNVGMMFYNTVKSGRVVEKQLLPQLTLGEWSNVEFRYDLSESDAVGIDSIHLWALNGGHDTFLEIKDMEFRTLDVGQLGTNIIKDVGFENVDLSGGDRTGWNDKHSGRIGAKDTQITWTSEGTKGEASYNQFARLSYNEVGDVQFVDLCSMVCEWGGSSWEAGIEAGEYLVEVDIRKNATFGETDNVGFAFFTSAGPRTERSLTDQVNAAPVDTWTTVSFRYPDQGVELTQAYADGVDSFQFWANSNSRVGAQLDVDNIEIRKISVAEDTRPEFEGNNYSFSWVEEEAKNLDIKIKDLHGYSTFKIVDENKYELALNDDYTYDSESKTISINKNSLTLYPDGTNSFTISTDGGSRDFRIDITHIQEPLPDVSGYELIRSVLGGDFADLDVGYKMSEDQTTYAWGSVALDDPGVIVAETDGTKALSLKHNSKTYASAFVMLDSAKITVDTIVTFECDYKYTNGAATDAAVDVSWVGPSNTSYRLIRLNGAKDAKTTEPAAKFRQWDISYTDLANGYTRIKCSFRVDAAAATSTNSIRFLMKSNGNQDQELRLQNVELKRWVKKLGGLEATTGSFVKGTTAGLNIVANLVDGASIDSIAVDTEVNYLKSSEYTVSEKVGGKVTINIKQEKLDKLSVGEHKLYITLTDGKEYVPLEFKLTVSEKAPDPQPSKGGCGSSIIVASATVSIFAGLGIALVSLKKRKEDK